MEILIVKMGGNIMKFLGISLLMMILTMMISIGMDMLMGFDAQKALLNAASPFRALENVEIFILFFLVLLLVFQSGISLIRQKKKDQDMNERLNQQK
jgi:hypothetical protein